MSNFVTFNEDTERYELFDALIEVDVPNGVVTVNGPIVPGGVTPSIQATVVGNHMAIGQHEILGVNSASPVTITLQSTLIAKKGQKLIVKDQSGVASQHNITLVTQGSEKIDGGDTKVIDTDYGVVRLYSDGANLFTF